MIKLIAPVALGLGLMTSSAVSAADRTVTLAVKTMYCAACPHTVKASLKAVPGVIRAVVSYKDQSVVVTYDDAKVDVGRS